MSISKSQEGALSFVLQERSPELFEDIPELSDRELFIVSFMLEANHYNVALSLNMLKLGAVRDLWQGWLPGRDEPSKDKKARMQFELAKVISDSTYTVQPVSKAPRRDLSDFEPICEGALYWAPNCYCHEQTF